MIVRANGQEVALADGASLGDLFEELGVNSKWVVAEVNGEAVPRAESDSLRLAGGDRIEMVRAVAGG